MRSMGARRETLDVLPSTTTANRACADRWRPWRRTHGRHAGRGGQTELVADVLLDPSRDGLTVAEEAAAGGDVEERLVEAEPLDQRRVAPEDVEDAGAELGIARGPRRYHDGLRAETHGPGHRHRRVRAEGPRLVGGGAYHAAAGRSAHEHRLSAERGIVQLLDRGEERVHVDVEDGAHLPRVAQKVADVADGDARPE